MQEKKEKIQTKKKEGNLKEKEQEEVDIMKKKNLK